MREKDGARLHVKSVLMGNSLVRKDLEQEIKPAPRVRIFPDVNVLKIGGQSICDRGKAALPAIVREIADNRLDHKMLLTAGGGTRSRHIYAIGLELGMPTGIIAKFGSTVSGQNALLLSMLLAPWGGVNIDQDDVVKLPTYFAQGGIPVTEGMPPYDYFALPTATHIPAHRTDVGTLLLADLIGARSCIFVKDVQGLYEDDPKRNPDAAFIPRAGARELINRDLPDLGVERPCLEILAASEVLSQIQIVNGLEPGQITAALRGEDVGTVIYKD